MEKHNINIAVSTCFDYTVPINEMIPLFARHGIQDISIGMDTSHCPVYRENGLQEFQQLLSTHDVRVHSIHIPSMPGLGLLSHDFEDRMSSMETVKTAMGHACKLNAPFIIMHATTFEYDENRFDDLYPVFKKSFDQLVKLADEQEINIAVENLYEEGRVMILKQILDDYPQEHIGFCFDTSHANLTVDPFELLRDYGDRIFTTHISDNWGQKDDHLLPFEGVFKWETFARYMHGLDPVQPLLFEPETVYSAIKDPSQFLREINIRARKLINMIVSGTQEK